ncbi:hypothetical protein [Rhizobium ruizarguesonis]|uniref:hypothetical protein n=1 Tax=Rhizobium ruizarguesonis TaxID=2081791 RepID=UPI002E15DEC1|nr:hypothetical protein U8P70_02055 [Rhizobium ruizarguesonis]
MVGISATILSDGLALFSIPGTSLLSKAIETYADKKLREAQDLLFQQVAEGNIRLLQDPNYENLIPNVLGYFEAAQRGEFNHNLKLLARLLIDKSELANTDAGLINRSARRLNSMSLEDLMLLARLKEIFDSKEAEGKHGGHYIFVEDRDIVEVLGREHTAPETKINSQLMDFASRGLLFLGGDPETIGGINFYRTEAFAEIISAAVAAV